MRLGPYILANRRFLAPMAGVTDRPFRVLCKQLERLRTASAETCAGQLRCIEAAFDFAPSWRLAA